MFDAPPDPAASPAPDDSAAQARLRRLQRMGDIGVRIGGFMERQAELAATYADTCAVPDHLHPAYGRRLDEIGRAFAQVCRAVVLAAALEDRLDTELRAGPAARAEAALKRRLLALRVETAQAEAAARVPPPARATDTAPDLRLRLDRRLDPGLADLDARLRRPPEEILAAIRADLGLAEDPADPPPDTPLPVDGGRESSAATPSAARTKALPPRGGKGWDGGASPTLKIDLWRRRRLPRKPVHVARAPPTPSAATPSAATPPSAAQLKSPSPSRGEGLGWGCIPNDDG